MDERQKLQLQKMISENNVLDQTDLIRQLKHSHKFHEEINRMLLSKKKNNNDAEKVHLECMSECPFMFTYYTEIYNKIRKDEIDLSILFKFVEVLQSIEEGQLDQHEASFTIGTLLKELYIDSALRKADKLNQIETEPKKEHLKVSWKQFKQMSRVKTT